MGPEAPASRRRRATAALAALLLQAVAAAAGARALTIQASAANCSGISEAFTALNQAYEAATKSSPITLRLTMDCAGGCRAPALSPAAAVTRVGWRDSCGSRKRRSRCRTAAGPCLARDATPGAARKAPAPTHTPYRRAGSFKCEARVPLVVFNPAAANTTNSRQPAVTISIDAGPKCRKGDR